MGNCSSLPTPTCNYRCPVCRQSGKLPNIAGRFFIINPTECQCNGCNTKFPIDAMYQSAVLTVEREVQSTDVSVVPLTLPEAVPSVSSDSDSFSGISLPLISARNIASGTYISLEDEDETA